MYKVTIDTFVHQELDEQEETFVETIEEGYEHFKKWSERPEIATGYEYVPTIISDTFIMASTRNKAIHSYFMCEPDVHNEHITHFVNL